MDKNRSLIFGRVAITAIIILLVACSVALVTFGVRGVRPELKQEKPKSSDTLKSHAALKETPDYGANYINNWLISRQDLEIENLVVRDGTVGIYGYAFYDSYMLISVTIPSSVKVIGENAFFNCMYPPPGGGLFRKVALR